jgi:hypothetical protein
MKNPPRRIEGEQEANIRRGFSTLSPGPLGLAVLARQQKRVHTIVNAARRECERHKLPPNVSRRQLARVLDIQLRQRVP